MRARVSVFQMTPDELDAGVEYGRGTIDKRLGGPFGLARDSVSRDLRGWSRSSSLAKRPTFLGIRLDRALAPRPLRSRHR